ALTGLVGPEQLAVSGDAACANQTVQLDPQHQPAQQTVTAKNIAIADGNNGGLASNYTLDNNSASTNAKITPKDLTVAITATDKTYDGKLDANVSYSLTGLVGPEQLAVSGDATFANQNVQLDPQHQPAQQTVTAKNIAIADGNNGGLASNYTLDNNSASTNAKITPKDLTVAIGAAAKTYDGSLGANVSYSLDGLVGPEQLAVSGNATFASQNVQHDAQGNVLKQSVTAKNIVIADGANGGLASNYTLNNTSASASAAITPAKLTYVANDAIGVLGGTLPLLSGSVDGFVAGETLAGATTGTAAWSTTAGNATQPGRYPVAGSGLSASNYVFVQDAGNATALTLTPLTPNVDQATKSVATDLDQAPQPQTWPFVHIPGPVFDVVAVMPLGSTDQDASFASVPLDAMTPEAIAALLAARDAYKDRLFADAIAELQRNPALADTPACADLRQAQTGECLLTEQLKGEARAEYFARLTEQVPVGAGPQAAAATLGSATAATGTAAAAAPQAADAFSDYRVKHAALPQIERKVAVLIGVDSFDDTRIPALDNAVNDAQAMARLFTSELGYETKVLKNATKKEVIATLNALVGEVGPKDSVIVYYAGHGDLVPATGLGYWQLADANADQPETWLSNSDIGKLMAQFGATQVALISDSCYSGALVSDRKIRASGPNADASLLLSRKAVVVMSSGGNEPVFDSSAGGHSPFASSLMAALKKMPDWQAGGNVFESVQQAVSKQLPQHPQYGASIAAGHQDGADYLFEQRQLDGVN
ncbi:MAG: caspase family protein, partial [Proteobacteria bacterium]|nr:caspase family protein [Pseudomonadota bacterium]